jgi:hypothetical protein
MENANMPSRFAYAALLIGGLLLTSCNTDVINPGRVDDQYLFDKSAQTAMVTGAGRAIAQGMNFLSYTGAAVSREIHPAGSTGSFGITARWQQGILEARMRTWTITGRRRSGALGRGRNYGALPSRARSTTTCCSRRTSGPVRQPHSR